MVSPEQLIEGTWALVEAWDIGDIPSEPTKKTYPWGNPPLGYWVFDKSRHFSLMISQNPALPIPPDPFTSPPAAQPGWLNPNAPWKVPYELLIDTFATAQPYAYFGTYTVESNKTQPGNYTMLLTVLSDVMRAYTNTVQSRPFTLEGTDIINVGVPGQYLRKLKRLT